MADFKTHMSVSTATGALLAFAGHRAGMSWDTCAVAGVLCSVSGMLPDLDSDSGRPLREATAMGAAVVPMLMVDRLQRLQLNHDTMVLVAIVTYFAIRFLMAELFRRYTVHRGMWHSLPAAAICGMVAFLIIANEDIGVRIYKTTAVVMGFLSHLLLDEIWSVEFRQASFKFKTSFGTAIKLWGNNRTASISAYATLLVSSALVYQDHGFMARYQENPNVPHTISELYASIKSRIERAAKSGGIEQMASELVDGTKQNPVVQQTVNVPNGWQNGNASTSQPQPGIPTSNWPPPRLPQGWQ